MADKPHKPDPATLPGGADFDVAGASTEDFDKHFEILERHAKLARLQPPVAVTVVDAPTVATPALRAADEIEAVHSATGEHRFFTPITWGLLGEDRQGWEAVVPKPADLG